MNEPNRDQLAALLRLQKEIFMQELYSQISDSASQRVFDAVVATFELCAKIADGTSVVGPMEQASAGLEQ